MRADVTERYGVEMLEPSIPKSVRAAEAPGEGRSIFEHAPRSTVAQAYRELADNLIERLT